MNNPKELVVGAEFNGSDYVPAQDKARLTGQIKRVFDLMRDGRWRTLSEIESTTGDPSASVSAQLRHLRKPKFGQHTIDKRTRGKRDSGLWEYKLLITQPDPVQGNLL